MSLKQYSTEDLKEELKKRQMKKPEELDVIEFSPVTQLCRQYISDIDKNGWVDDDLQHYIFEAAMKSVYGPKVFDWINKQL